MTAPTKRRLVGPPGFPTDYYLSRLRHSGMGGTRQNRFRRERCRADIVMWALTYFPEHLTSADTGGLVSLSEFHVEAARAALQWARTDLAPTELRRAWVSARGSGKSTWWNLIMPLWALAHGHRTFIVAFSHTGAMAKRHLMSLRAELAKNEKLRADYPELCEPARFGRRSVMDTQEGYVSASGAAIIVAGMDQGTLGIKFENRRPDLLIVDDGEGPEGGYSDYQKTQRLKILREAILPMSLNAAVELVGTTTRLGSILDDVLRGADWAVEENIRPRHFPALVVDPETGEERSAWPQRWSLEFLQSIRHTHSFAKNYQCEPVSADGTHWKTTDFVYDDKGTLARYITGKVLCVDPAVTSSKSADETGLAVVSFAGGVRKCLVERAVGVRRSPKEMQELVHRTLLRDPMIREVIVECNNGGEYIVQALSPLPNKVKLIVSRASESKASRITELYYQYEDGKVQHSKPHPSLERQMCAWPHVDTDDIIDAVEAGVRHWLGKYQPRPAR